MEIGFDEMFAVALDKVNNLPARIAIPRHLPPVTHESIQAVKAAVGPARNFAVLTRLEANRLRRGHTRPMAGNYKFSRRHAVDKDSVVPLYIAAIAMPIRRSIESEITGVNQGRFPKCT